MIVCVVAPVDHEYDVKPLPALSVTLPPAHVDDGPMIVTFGFAFAVTARGVDVPLQPFAVTVTL